MAMATLTTATTLKQTLPLQNTSESNDNYRSAEENRFLRRKKAEDEEIGVFSAEKYFNGVIDVDTPRISRIVPKEYDQPNKEDGQIGAVPVKPKLNPATPRVRSESSWNSQKALIRQTFQRKTWQRNMDKAKGKIKKNFLAGFGCKCVCSDKESIDVDDENVREISFRKNTNNAALLQSKPIAEGVTIKPCSGPSRVNEELSSASGNLENPGKSLEVFGSPVHEKTSKSFRIERRLSMLSWDAPRRMEETEYSDTPSGLFNNDNDNDASSSDLFEIESLKANPFLASQGSDVTSGCVTPTTGYPPSETSIEWSVVTASAADFSVISDYEELRPPTTVTSAPTFLTTAKPKTTSTVKETSRRGPGILLGCNSSKAVGAAGDAHRTHDHKPNYDPQLRRVSDSYTQVTRFPAENKLVGFDSTQKQRAFSTLSLPRSQRLQTSSLFYIQ